MQIGRLRYQIYVTEMNRIQHYADHDQETIFDPLDKFATVLAAESHGRFIGTVRSNCCRNGDLGDYAEFYEIDPNPAHRQRSSITTRLMVEPAFRGSRAPLLLAMAAFNFGLREGIRWNYIDCNLHLLSFFERLGYIEQFTKRHPEYGNVHCMRLDLHDLTHLAAVNSPFLSSARTYLAERPAEPQPAPAPWQPTGLVPVQ